MKRRVVWSVVALLVAACPLWTAAVSADEPDSAALKADIEVLKQRLAELESQVSNGSFHGPEGEAGGLPTLVLPSGLQGLALSGYADVSYIYNFNEPDPTTGTGNTGARTNRGRAFDTEPNGFTPHAFELVFEKAATDTMPVGFRADVFMGDDAEVFGTGHGLGINADEIELQQAYITARAPVGGGIDFKAGKFVTLLGAEVIESPSNWNFSRSYMFNYSIPFTHTGLLASYPLGELGSATLGVVNGWERVDDINKAKSLIGNITLTPFENLTLYLNGITGAEQTGDSRNKRTVFDLVASYQATEKLALMANYDYGHESGIVPGTALTRGYDSVGWTGLALYAKYDLSPTWLLAGRWEWFDDKDNVRTNFGSFGGGTPLDIDFYEWTLTSQWKLREHVLARLEYRHDFADQRVFFQDKYGFSNHQDTLAAELIYTF